MESFKITTANDRPGRDPASWELYGFGDGDDNAHDDRQRTSTGAGNGINASGLAEAWTLIGSGPLALPGNPDINNDQRNIAGPLVDVPTTIGYQHYKMVFPTLKDEIAPAVDSIQYAEVQLFIDDAGTSLFNCADDRSDDRRRWNYGRSEPV